MVAEGIAVFNLYIFDSVKSSSVFPTVLTTVQMRLSGSLLRLPVLSGFIAFQSHGV